jgi:hypothetical protein
MLERVSIRTETAAVLRPLLKTALQHETGRLAHSIKRTRARLETFEKQFGMQSEEFERRFEANELSETLDFIDWLMEIQALRLLDEQRQALQNTRPV